MSVGERIRARRIELGMTQAELAKRIGTTYQAISKYENDSIDTIPNKKLSLIAYELGVSPMYLLGMTEDNGCILKCPRRTKPGAWRVEGPRQLRAEKEQNARKLYAIL